MSDVGRRPEPLTVLLVKQPLQAAVHQTLAALRKTPTKQLPSPSANQTTSSRERRAGRLTVAVQGPEQRVVGVVRPPTQAVVEVAHAVG